MCVIRGCGQLRIEHEAGIAIRSLRGGAAVAKQHLLCATGGLQHQAASAIRPAGGDIVQQVQVLLVH